MLASIPRKERDADQLRADLLALTRFPTPDGRRPALARWFTTAADITAQDHNPATQQFARWAVLAERPGAFASESWRPIEVPSGGDDEGRVVTVRDVHPRGGGQSSRWWAATVDRPLTWPGPAPVVVELPSGSLPVDRDEVSVADLGDCQLPDPPADQRDWCAAPAGVITGVGISEAVIAGAGRRSVMGVSSAVAVRICAMRGMRLPWDDEFRALLALGQPAWPADEAEFATLALRDVRGAQAIRRLATGAAEFVRVERGYRVRGVPLVSAAAMRVAEMAPRKALHEVASPPMGEGWRGRIRGPACG